MAFASVTRLQLRSAWRLPLFMWHTLRAAKQAADSHGFLGGYLASESVRAFWTVTVWNDETAMRSFRNTGAHMVAMPKLLDWCDEASFAHWSQPEAQVPSRSVAVDRMLAHGRLSKVRRPSAEHQGGRLAPPDVTLRPGRSLVPRSY